MYGRLTFAGVVLLVLAATHWKAYHSGMTSAEAKAARQALVAEQVAREREQQLVLARQKVEERYAQEKRVLQRSAAGAQSELDRLRDELAGGRQAGSDPTAPGRADGSASLERELLSSCAGALVQLAAEADGLAARLIGLQGYVREVCLAPK